MGEDPRLVDPEHGDYRTADGSPAAGYGCQTFGPPARDSAPALREQIASTMPMTREQVLEVAGPIGADAIWDADIIRVTGDVTVLPGVTLTVTPGVRVEFTGHYALYVNGAAQAAGSAAAPILWTSADPSGFAIDSTTTGSWFGLRFVGQATGNDSSYLHYCVIEYCKAAGDGARGGALFVRGAVDLRIADCIFRHNVADYGAVAYCDQYAAPRISSSLMIDNHAFVAGSAIYCLDAYPLLANDTITGNVVHNPDPFVETACVHTHISKPRIANCILWEDPSHYFLGGEIREGKHYYVTYNDVSGGHAGQGNFDLNPLFAGSGPHPFALSDGSPCIDAGDESTAGLELPLLDLAGAPRVCQDRVDSGGYEWGAPSEAGEDHAAQRIAAYPSIRVQPNPITTEGRISLRLVQSQRFTLRIVDLAGREVRALRNDEWLPEGEHEVVWDGRDDLGARVGAGIYSAVLTSATGAAATKLIVIP